MPLHVQNALEMLEYSIRSYLEPTMVFDEDAVYIAKKEDRIVVSFRGTLTPTLNAKEFIDSVEDWLNDADSILVKKQYGCGLVHKGFSKSLDNLWNFILTYLDDNLKIFVTGHSKGGAIANLFALRCYSIGKQVEEIYTFGAPATGNLEHQKYYESIFYEKHFRIVNRYDIVPHLPPSFYVFKLLNFISLFRKKIKTCNNFYSYRQLDNLSVFAA